MNCGIKIALFLSGLRNNIFTVCTISCLCLGATQAQEAHTDSMIYSSLKSIDTLDNDSSKVRQLLSYAGRTYRYHPSAKILIDRAYNLSAKINDEHLLAETNYSYGNYFMYASMMDSAEARYNMALNFPNIDNFPFLKAHIQSSASHIFKQKGLMSEALEKLLSGLKILEDIDTVSLSSMELFKRDGQMSTINNGIGNLYNDMGEEELAVQYYSKAYSTLLEMGEKGNAGIILGNIGDLQIDLGKLDEAFESISQSKELKQNAQLPPRYIASAELNLGIIYNRKNQYNKAIEQYEIAQQLYKQGNYFKGQVEATLRRGELFLTMQEFQKAKEDCETALSGVQKLNDALDMYSQTCFCLYQANKSLGNYQKALYFYENHVSLKDSIFNAENIKQLTQLEMQYNFDREQYLIKLESDIQEQEYQRVKRVLIAGMVAISIIAFLLYYLFQLRKKANKTLSFKNEQITRSLDEKEILLKEIHHRVKNNLQIISSLLSLQSRKIDNPKAKEAIQVGRNRIKSMALIHQNLYQDEDLIGVDLHEYVTKLSNSLVKNYSSDDKIITIDTMVAPIKLDVDTLIPIGLILNEIITNALKYAFKDQDKGTITIKMENDNGHLIMNVMDTGKGLPPDFDAKTAQSLGFRLIYSLSDKLNACVKINSSASGTEITIDIPNPKIFE
ncbi:tetratricopeptide repeat-containing sensor histidine kinase [Membranihabitans maritimus]|uniref:tetratricopeptide repeat-containing sensor histidine kinase n=1 Tax=Membranihabitans maritimus TaxID=2904244 RepID=UPI001F2E1744|nr:histidine kinase dimerization/phosphoacceptor domain -containing protein [Membranihabitans maritimus]